MSQNFSILPSSPRHSQGPWGLVSQSMQLSNGIGGVMPGQLYNPTFRRLEAVALTGWFSPFSLCPHFWNRLLMREFYYNISFPFSHPLRYWPFYLTQRYQLTYWRQPLFDRHWLTSTSTVSLPMRGNVSPRFPHMERGAHVALIKEIKQ
jgi:hypothetical protein